MKAVEENDPKSSLEKILIKLLEPSEIISDQRQGKGSIKNVWLKLKKESNIDTRINNEIIQYLYDNIIPDKKKKIIYLITVKICILAGYGWSIYGNHIFK